MHFMARNDQFRFKLAIRRHKKCWITFTLYINQTVIQRIEKDLKETQLYSDALFEVK